MSGSQHLCRFPRDGTCTHPPRFSQKCRLSGLRPFLMCRRNSVLFSSHKNSLLPPLGAFVLDGEALIVRILAWPKLGRMPGAESNKCCAEGTFIHLNGLIGSWELGPWRGTGKRYDSTVNADILSLSFQPYTQASPGSQRGSKSQPSSLCKDSVQGQRLSGDVTTREVRGLSSLYASLSPCSAPAQLFQDDLPASLLPHYHHCQTHSALKTFAFLSSRPSYHLFPAFPLIR